MILEERPPGLRGRCAALHHVLGDTGLADPDAELEQLAVNAWRTPKRIFTAQRSDEYEDFVSRLSASCFAATDLPAPEQAQALAMPADHGGGLHQGQSGLPTIPNRAQPSPQQAVRRGQLGSFEGALQDAELMPQGQDLELKRGSAS